MSQGSLPAADPRRPGPETRAKPVHHFLLQAAVLLALIGLFPSVVGMGGFYSEVFAAEGNWLFGSRDGDRHVRFQPIDREVRRDRSDMQMTGRARGAKENLWRAVYSTRRSGWWPTAALLALLAATPMPRGRRILALVAGVVLQNAVLLGQVGVVAWIAFRAVDPATTTEGWVRAVDVARATFTSPLPSLASVFVLWALLGHPARSIDLRPAERLIGSALRRDP